MKIAVTLGALTCALSVTVQAAEPAAYPSRPVRFIVPFGAGSATDVVARTVGQNLSEALGQPIVVDNRAGANGTIGAELAAKSPKDGYTILMSTNTPSAAAPSLMKKINYDPVKDFVQPLVETIFPSDIGSPRRDQK